MIVVHGHFHIRSDSVEAFASATLENARHSIREPGIARFDVVQQEDDPTRFVLVEIFAGPEAIESHRGTDHFKKWREATDGLLATPRVVNRYSQLFP